MLERTEQARARLWAQEVRALVELAVLTDRGPDLSLELLPMEVAGSLRLWAVLGAEQALVHAAGLDELCRRVALADAQEGIARTADQRRADVLAMLPAVALAYWHGADPGAGAGATGPRPRTRRIRGPGSRDGSRTARTPLSPLGRTYVRPPPWPPPPVPRVLPPEPDPPEPPTGADDDSGLRAALRDALDQLPPTPASPAPERDLPPPC